MNQIVFYSTLTPVVSTNRKTWGWFSDLARARARLFQQSASLPPVLRNAEQRGTHFPRIPLPSSPPYTSGWSLHEGNSGEIWKAWKERESIILQRWRKPDAAQMWNGQSSELSKSWPLTSGCDTFHIHLHLRSSAPSSAPPLCQQSCKPLKLY